MRVSYTHLDVYKRQGYDIIFFWVARMIFSACEQMHEIPFHTVLIHGPVSFTHLDAAKMAASSRVFRGTAACRALIRACSCP